MSLPLLFILGKALIRLYLSVSGIASTCGAAGSWVPVLLSIHRS